MLPTKATLNAAASLRCGFCAPCSHGSLHIRDEGQTGRACTYSGSRDLPWRILFETVWPGGVGGDSTGGPCPRHRVGHLHVRLRQTHQPPIGGIQHTPNWWHSYVFPQLLWVQPVYLLLLLRNGSQEPGARLKDPVLPPADTGDNGTRLLTELQVVWIGGYIYVILNLAFLEQDIDSFHAKPKLCVLGVLWFSAAGMQSMVWPLLRHSPRAAGPLHHPRARGSRRQEQSRPNS